MIFQHIEKSFRALKVWRWIRIFKHSSFCHLNKYKIDYRRSIKAVFNVLIQMLPDLFLSPVIWLSVRHESFTKLVILLFSKLCWHLIAVTHLIKKHYIINQLKIEIMTYFMSHFATIMTCDDDFLAKFWIIIGWSWKFKLWMSIVAIFATWAKSR